MYKLIIFGCRIYVRKILVSVPDQRTSPLLISCPCSCSTLWSPGSLYSSSKSSWHRQDCFQWQYSSLSISVECLCSFKTSKILRIRRQSLSQHHSAFLYDLTWLWLSKTAILPDLKPSRRNLLWQPHLYSLMMFLLPHSSGFLLFWVFQTPPTGPSSKISDELPFWLDQTPWYP